MNSKEAAEFLSHVFNAPVVAAFTFLILLISEEPSNLLVLTTISLAFGTVIPLMLLYLLSLKGIIPDIYASERESRTVPFLAAMLSYLLGAVALLAVEAPPIITAVMLCYLGNSLVMTLITLKWKISVHTSGIAGPATALTYSLGIGALFFLGLVIPVGWARIKLRAYTPAQVLAGALVTIATTWLQLGIHLMLLQLV
jgi:hypothetical protein